MNVMYWGQLTLICAFSSAGPVFAELIAYEPFDYMDVSSDLFDTDGGAGFFGQWLQYDGAPVLDNWRISEGSLTYPGLQSEGNSVTSEVLFNDSWVGLLRELDNETDETVTNYLSFLMRPEGEVGEGAFGGAFGVVLASLDGGGDLLIGMTEGAPNYMIETFFNTATRFSDAPVESEETSLLVVKAELGPGADTFTLFVNPVPGQPEPVTGTVKSNLDIGVVIGIGIAAAGGVSVDELRWGDTFADVTPATEHRLLQAGDADQDLDFDQLDLVRVQIAGKYLTGQAATWGDGDWNGAPGGSPGSPPQGNGLFDQLDIIAALGPGVYLTGPYAAIVDGGQPDDARTSIVYDATTGELGVDAPSAVELTSVNIDSAAAIFTGQAAQNLGGSFDNDADSNIFKATFGGSFGSLSFGNVALTGLSKEFVLNDLSVVGSLQGGGDLGEVDLIYVPEPASALLLSIGLLLRFARRGQ